MQELCQAADVELPLAHVDGFLSHRNLQHLPLEKDTDSDAWWGDWGAGKKVLHDFAARVSSQPIFIGAAERRWKAYAHIRCPKRIRNWCECTITCLRRKLAKLSVI